jgi:hypothetical protein
MAFSLAAQQEGLFGQLLVGHDHGDATHAQQLGHRLEGIASPGARMPVRMASTSISRI